ncbi:MAG: haloacid dehalogenase-like hydrolase [Actinobacteria bacterium]|nr:haloacid dehalogenase-like hydrolase [Actinomycetota bacterium]
MPPPLYTQSVIACIWDFDKTLIPGNMQGPLFVEYGVDEAEFWGEVEALVDFHANRGEILGRDMAYLLHILTYVERGIFKNLTNAKLKQLGAELVPVLGMPEFMDVARKRVEGNPEFAKEGITVEHYIVSTGIRPMIEGSTFAGHIDEIWANTFVASEAGPGYLDRLDVAAEGDDVIKHVGLFIGNTSKTRALFEINKGVNTSPQLDVNARMTEEQRRVPLRNMIYIADGPSDVPVFSILNTNGGKTLGVYNLEPRDNYKQVKELADQGRIQGLAEADFREGEGAYLWMVDSIDQIAYEITESKQRALAAIKSPPGHA